MRVETAANEHLCPELAQRQADPDDPCAIWAIRWLAGSDGLLYQRPGWYVVTDATEVPIIRCPLCGVTLTAPDLAARRDLPLASKPLGARAAGRGG